MDARTLERLIDVGPALFIATNLQGQIVEARGAWKKVLGWEPKDIVGRHFESLIHPDDVAGAWKVHREAHRSGDPVIHYEVRYLHADGSYRWISWAAPPPTPELGAAFGVDVTEQRAEYAALQRTRSQLRSILETVPFIVTHVDRQGIVQYLNRAVPPLSTDQVIGTHILNWYPPAQRKSLNDAFERALAGQQTEFLGKANTPAGPTWFRSRMGPLMGPDGEVAAVTSVLEDVSASKQAEERLIQASRLEAIGQVAGAVAHDFNNVLAVILADVELLELELAAPSRAVKESLERMAQVVLRARSMTDQLLEPVRQKPANTEGCDLSSGVRELDGMLRLAAGEGVRLGIDLLNSPLTVRVAPHELQQLLVNLVVNSREALAGHGEVRVTLDRFEVDADPALEAGTYARLRVQDNGPGIPEALRARVLEPFFSTKAGGTGFGLSTSYALACTRGGDLRIDCPEQGGTLVTILFPLLSAPVSSPPAAPASDAVRASKSLTILLVDDNALLRSNIARYLTRGGHTVLEAGDGDDALEVLARHPLFVDAVVSDLMMKPRGGLSLLRELRASSPELQLVAISGFCDAEQLAALSDLGVALLNKPVSPRELLAHLQRQP